MIDDQEDNAIDGFKARVLVLVLLFCAVFWTVVIYLLRRALGGA